MPQGPPPTMQTSVVNFAIHAATKFSSLSGNVDVLAKLFAVEVRSNVGIGQRELDGRRPR